MTITRAPSPTDRGSRLVRLIQCTTENARRFQEMSTRADDPFVASILRESSAVRGRAATELWSCITDRSSLLFEGTNPGGGMPGAVAPEQWETADCVLREAIRAEQQLDAEYVGILRMAMRASIRRVLIRQQRELRLRLNQLQEISLVRQPWCADRVTGPADAGAPIEMTAAV